MLDCIIASDTPTPPFKLDKFRASLASFFSLYDRLRDSLVSAGSWRGGYDVFFFLGEKQKGQKRALLNCLPGEKKL